MKMVLLVFAAAVAGNPVSEETCTKEVQQDQAKQQCVSLVRTLEADIRQELKSLIDERATGGAEPEALSPERLDALRNKLQRYHRIIERQELNEYAASRQFLLTVANSLCPMTVAPDSARHAEIRASATELVCKHRLLSETNATERLDPVRRQLRETADTLFERNEQLRSQIDRNRYLGLVTEDTLKEYVEELKANQEVLDEIASLTGYEINTNDPFRPFSELDLWHIDYTLGVNFLSVDDAFEKGYPVAGLGIYRRFATDSELDAMPASFGKFFKSLHLSSHLRLNGVGEQIEPGAGEGDNGGNGLADYDEHAFDMDVSLFYPLWKLSHNRSHDYLGLIATGGGRKIDSDPRFRDRFYYGLRMIYNSQFYIDALIGESDPLKSKRLELRGQFPIYRGGKDSFVYVGAAVNAAYAEKWRNEPDTVNFYILFQSNAETLFNLK